MARIKNILEDIAIMRMKGYSCSYIAEQLQVPIDWTNCEVVEEMIQVRSE